MAKIISWLLLLPSFVWAQNFSTDSLEKLLPKKFTGQITLKQDSTLSFSKNFGPKDRVFGTLVNDSTVFNVGQISHTIVDYLVEHLSSLGQLNDTDKVQKFIGNFPYPEIKIKDLLNHSSGLPTSYIRLYHKQVYNDWNIKLEDRQGRFDNYDILQLLSKKKPILSFNPGDSIQFSDLNYLILSSLIEKVTLTPFGHYATQVLKQAKGIKIKASANNDTLSNKAFGYREFRDGGLSLCENLKTRGLPFDDGTYGNQHIYFSAKELLNWGDVIRNRINAQNLINNSKSYSFGGFKYDSKLKIIIKIGAFGGTYSRLIFFPNNGINVVINSSYFNPELKGEEFDELVKYLSSIN